jgi:predicted ATPase/DNA-binding CsgD family transcriptional regulator
MAHKLGLANRQGLLDPSPDKQKSVTKHNLPQPNMPFIGREEEIVAIAQRLADPTCSLLTLVGPGGMGKTRLALEVAQYIAQTFPPADGIHFVDLQPLKSGDFLEATICNTLGLLLSGPEDPRAQLLSYLNGRDNFLLLDNFEHVLDSVDLLADIVKTAPDIKLLVTSREALNMQEEWLWLVGGLQVPDDAPDGNIESFSAVQLFAERARRTRQDFALTGQEAPITRTCQLVEGMPLALELAASWTKALSCAEIADEIQRGLDFLTTNTRNVPERHRSMQAVFDQSWHLLTEAERQVFPRLSVFRGGFRREAAEQVAGGSLAVLAGLVDKSFLRVSAGGRYDIHELIRQYAEEHLEAVPGAKEDAQYQHCVYYAGFLHQCQTTLRGSEQARALDEIEDDLDNIRASWEWAVERGLIQVIHQSMHSLYIFCHIRAQAAEGQRLFDLAVRHFENDNSPTLAYLLLGGIRLSWFNGRNIDASRVRRAIRLAYTFWTEDEIAILIRSYIEAREVFIANYLFYDKQYEQVCRDFYERFTAHAQPWGASFMLFNLGGASLNRGQFDGAERYYRESLDGFLLIGDRWASAWPLMGLAWLFQRTERYHEALQMWQEHLDICAEVGDRGGVVYALANKAIMTWKLQDYNTARFYAAQSIKSYLEAGSQYAHLSILFQALIAVFISKDRQERATEILSLLRQHADKAHAPKVVEEAEQKLVFLAQQLPPDVYRQALERGKKLHLRTILEQLVDELSDYSPSPPSTPQFDSLTERELEVLRLTAAGHSNRQIAQELVLTLNTVKSHIHHIYGKLGVASRTQAVARARELHLL